MVDAERLARIPSRVSADVTSLASTRTEGLELDDLSLRAVIARAVGFRNILVHEYSDVDDSAVVANLVLVGDLDRYVVQLAAWAAQQ